MTGNGGIAFILNAHAGRSPAREALADHLPAMRRLAGDSQIAWIDDGAQIAAAVDRAKAAGCRIVVAGGGDGTISSVAGSLVGSGIGLGVLPLGTLNHFAKDLGVPLALDAALDTIAAGHMVDIDVAEVNGRFFLNNSSLGLYPTIVREREMQQSRLGRGKWPAFARATLSAMRRHPFLKVRLTLDSRTEEYRTAFVFVGNNEYGVEGLETGARAALDGGMLSVWVAKRPGRWPLVKMAFHALIGKLNQARDFHATLARDVLIETHHRRMRVSTDGEVRMTDMPLAYRIRPKALRVVVPK